MMVKNAREKFTNVNRIFAVLCKNSFKIDITEKIQFIQIYRRTNK